MRTVSLRRGALVGWATEISAVYGETVHVKFPSSVSKSNRSGRSNTCADRLSKAFFDPTYGLCWFRKGAKIFTKAKSIRRSSKKGARVHDMAEGGV